MASQFDGMSSREIQGMPATEEATGQQIAALFGEEDPSYIFAIALAQESYVRQVLLACPGWRKRKRLALEGALAKARLVADVNFRRVLRVTAPA